MNKNSSLAELTCTALHLFLDIIYETIPTAGHSVPATVNPTEKFIIDSLIQIQNDIRTFSSTTSTTLQDTITLQKEIGQSAETDSASLHKMVIDSLNKSDDISKKLDSTSDYMHDQLSSISASLQTSTAPLDALQDATYIKDSIVELKTLNDAFSTHLTEVKDTTVSSSILDEKLKLLQTDINDLKNLKPDISNLLSNIQRTSSSVQQSYADILTTHLKSHKPSPPSHPSIPTASAKPTIIIKPKGDNAEQDLLPLLKNNLDPTKSKTRIDRVSALSSGNIIIQTKTDDEADQLLKEITSNSLLKDNLDIQKQQKRSPRLIILNLPTDLSPAFIKDTLVSQNEYLHNDNFEVNFKIPAKNGEHWVITIHPSIYKFLSKEKHLYFGWNRVLLNDFHSLKHCKACHRFGHLEKACREVKTCQHCAQEQHDGPCSTEHPVCINCMEFSKKFSNSNIDCHHHNKSLRCPSRARQISFLSKFIDYGFTSSSPPSSS